MPRTIARDLRFLRRSACAVLVLLGFTLCYVAQELLVPVILAVLFALILSPLATLLERLRLPRSIAAVCVLALLLGALAAGVASLAQPARDWVANAPQTIRTIEQRIEGIRAPLRQAEEATQKIEDLARTSPPAHTFAAEHASLLMMLATNAPRALAAVLAVLLLVYFFLASGDGLLRRAVELAPGFSEKKVLVGIARDVQGEMSRYLTTVSLINFGLGVVTALAMYLLGLPTPLLWGAVAMIFNFAPYVGPATTGLLLAIAGLATFDSLGHALAAPGIFFCCTFLEGQLITPTIVGRRLALDPLIVFVWLMLWGWLWGVVGLLVASPLLACVRIVSERVESLHALGVLIGDGSSHDAAHRVT